MTVRDIQENIRNLPGRQLTLPVNAWPVQDSKLRLTIWQLLLVLDSFSFSLGNEGPSKNAYFLRRIRVVERHAEEVLHHLQAVF
jgi:hypothetical protein